MISAEIEATAMAMAERFDHCPWEERPENHADGGDIMAKCAFRDMAAAAIFAYERFKLDEIVARERNK